MEIWTCVLLILLMHTPLLPCVLAAPPAIPRQMEIIEASIEGGSIPTVDPAACYDTASGSILVNCYDTLVFFDGEHLDKYLPQLAAEWSIVQNNGTSISANTGLEFYYTYYFKIRTGVQWQNPAFGTVTPADVEYTFERGMVLEPGDNPQWMFYEPLLNGATMTYIDGHDVDPEGNLTERAWVGWAIDEAVESNVTHVWFNLAFPGAYAPFMQILTQQWSSIVCKAWANSLGRPSNWNGTWGDDHTAYYPYHYPAVSPFDDPTPAVMGSGPFKLAHLDQTLHCWDANRFTNYWRGWPLDWPGFGRSRPAGYINHLKVSWAWNWPTRKAMFLSGDVDICEVPRANASEVQGQNGIRCMYPLPKVGVNGFLFNYNIDPGTPYCNVFDYGILGEDGVPRDFFGNSTWGIHVRKAFAQSVDFDTLISRFFGSDTQRPATAIVQGLSYHDPSISRCNFNLTEAAKEFQTVPNLWDTGFTIELSYAEGNSRLQYFYTMIKQAIEPLNPKFHVSVTSRPIYMWFDDKWWPIYWPGYAWSLDYPDAHNFAWAFYWSHGGYARYTSYSDHEMDNLVERGIATPDGPERAQIYHEIQQLVFDTCPSVMLHQPIDRHFERDWVCGWYYNPIYSGVYAANLWKWYYTPHAQQDTVTNATANLLPCDTNHDGKTNMKDVGMAAMCFEAAYGPPISSRWNFRCDFNNDRKVDMKDIGGVAQNFSKTSLPWSPSP